MAATLGRVTSLDRMSLPKKTRLHTSLTTYDHIRPQRRHTTNAQMRGLNEKNMTLRSKILMKQFDLNLKSLCITGFVLLLGNKRRILMLQFETVRKQFGWTHEIRTISNFEEI